MKHNYFYKDVISIEGYGTVVNLMFTVGDVETEAKALLYGNDDFTLEVFEDATAIGGNPITPFSCNRGNDRSPLLTLVSAPTITDDGNLIWKSRTAASKNSTGVLQNINYTQFLLIR